jgi:hypothetical protein
MTHLRLYETPNLGVHQTGSSSIGPFSVSAKGIEAVRAIQWPVAFAVVLWAPVTLGLVVYGLAHIDVLRSLLWKWWP